MGSRVESAAAAAADSGGGGKDEALAMFFLSLLAVQFGLQPFLVSQFQVTGVPKLFVVLFSELIKLGVAIVYVNAWEDRAVRRRMWEEWSLRESLRLSALPAVLYAAQNWLLQYGYANLDSLSFNVLNQTKTLSTAVWLYVLMRKRQSPVQLVALALLFFAAILLQLDPNASFIVEPQTESGTAAALPVLQQVWAGLLRSVSGTTFRLGTLPVLLASAISGLSTSLTQQTLQNHGRHSCLFSAELAVYGLVFVVGGLYANGGLEASRLTQVALLVSNQPSCLMPAVVQALAGLTVGLVTRYAGGIRKGYALIAGILLTGFIQVFLEQAQVPWTHWTALAVVVVSMYLHTNPGSGSAVAAAAGGGGKAKAKIA